MKSSQDQTDRLIEAIEGLAVDIKKLVDRVDSIELRVHALEIKEV